MRGLKMIVAAMTVYASASCVAQVSGSGTTDRISKFVGSSTLGDSAISESNGVVVVGAGSPLIDFSVSVAGGSGNGAMVSASNGSWGKILAGAGQWAFNPLVKAGDTAFIFASGGMDSGGYFLGPWSGSANGLRMTNTGNIGIGTGDPDAGIDLYRKGSISGGGAPSLWIGDGTPYSSADNSAVNGMIGFRGAGWKNGFISYYPHKSDGNNYFELGGTSSNYGDYPAGLLTARLGVGISLPTAKLEVNGNVKLTAGSGASITFADDSVQSTAWNGTTCGGDYAESVDVAGDRKTYEPGDVLVIDPDHEGGFLKSSEAYATGVTGVFSTKPGLTGRRQLTAKSEDEVPMAMVGIVPTKVSAENGAIRPGDLLVASSKPGYAMKGTDRTKMLGAVIGKALGHLDKATGVIEVVILMQ